jgi:hypothetical protein
MENPADGLLPGTFGFLPAKRQDFTVIRRFFTRPG